MLLIPCLFVLGALPQQPLLPSFTITTKVFEVPEGTKVTRENTDSLSSAKILLQPTIAALSGNKGEMFIGDEIKYTIDEKTTGVAHSGWRIAATASEDKNGMIRLVFHSEWSYITGWYQKLPQISTRFVDTISLLKSGEKALVPFGKSENKLPLYALVTVTRDNR
ncbi:hypothetical protein [Armatimonas sp.]|uniref:hypothetical protein n=1 Tax=Armatimonas sp. TaxID=1872638 RepID=UPI00286BC0C8|nr:hypothetical protein [Armatimonas sp.]